MTNRTDPQPSPRITPGFTLKPVITYEYQKTGSLWAGYNFSLGHKLVLDATPMFGIVFGSTTGAAPSYELLLSYSRVELSAQGEYVFNTSQTI